MLNLFEIFAACSACAYLGLCVPYPVQSKRVQRSRVAVCHVCSVLGHLAPVPRCACPACGVACAVSRASWLLFTGVLARCAVLRVRCPGPLGSRSPVCSLGVSCRGCGVPGHLAPVHRCACWVCRVVCAVSWATWLLFTGVLARCVVSCVRCPGPLGACSTVCLPYVWCFVCGVLGLVAPVHRCAWSVCCVACAGSGAAWLLLSGVRVLRVVLRVRCPGPCGSCSPVCLPGVSCCLVPWFVAGCARSPGSRQPAAVVAWHLSVYLGCGRRRASLACVVAPRGARRLVRSGRSRCAGRPSLCRGAFPYQGLAPLDLLGGCAGHLEAGRELASWCLPLAPAEAGALGSLRVVPVRGPAMGLSLAGPSGGGLGLRALRWLCAC